MENEIKYGNTTAIGDLRHMKFKEITEALYDTYKRKNADYGDSFGKSVEKYGPIAALTRMSDKFNRIENLILNGNAKVVEESLGDSLLDMANYAIMTYIAMRFPTPVIFERE